jgi:hypothetical protein
VGGFQELGARAARALSRNLHRRAHNRCAAVTRRATEASPVEWQKRIVRDRHTGKLAEIDLHEFPPVREAELGRSYVFKRDEKVRADHEAVLDAPGCFREADGN